MNINLTICCLLCFLRQTGQFPSGIPVAFPAVFRAFVRAGENQKFKDSIIFDMRRSGKGQNPVFIISLFCVSLPLGFII